MNKKEFKFMLFVLIGTCYLISCSDESKNPIVDPSTKAEVKKVNPQKLTLKDSLLLEINICKDSISDLITSSCVVDILFLPIKEDYSLSDGFVIQIKYMQEDIPVLLTNVYQRNSNKELIKLNEFKGFLIVTEGDNGGYKDILLRFIEIEEDKKFFYNCWFTYSMESSKYVYKECFSINQESKKGDYQFDVYSSKDASKRDEIQTNREVEAILNDLNYLN